MTKKRGSIYSTIIFNTMNMNHEEPFFKSIFINHLNKCKGEERRKTNVQENDLEIEKGLAGLTG